MTCGDKKGCSWHCVKILPPRECGDFSGMTWMSLSPHVQSGEQLIPAHTLVWCLDWKGTPDKIWQQKSTSQWQATSKSPSYRKSSRQWNLKLKENCSSPAKTSLWRYRETASSVSRPVGCNNKRWMVRRSEKSFNVIGNQDTEWSQLVLEVQRLPCRHLQGVGLIRCPPITNWHYAVVRSKACPASHDYIMPATLKTASPFIAFAIAKTTLFHGLFVWQTYDKQILYVTLYFA